MKNGLIFFGIALLSSCTSIKENKEATTIVLQNTLSLERHDEHVVIPYAKLSSFLDSTTKFRLIDLSDSSEIPYQLDDLDGDGQWDELAMLGDFKPKESKKMQFHVGETPAPLIDRTNIHLGYSPTRNDTFVELSEHTRPIDHVAQSKPWLYQFEGPGWENDKIGFRSYFDARNGKDIFGKRTKDMVLDQVGLPIGTEEGNYHHIQPWGMDILKVGPSLGAGALGMVINDSLYRLGETSSASFKIITEGPVRSIFELSYKGWDIQDQQYDLTERITIWAGQYHYDSEISISPKPVGSLVTGLVTMKTEQPLIEKETTDYAYVLSYDKKQSENHDALGMAIITPKECFERFETADTLHSAINSSALVLFHDAARFLFISKWHMSTNPLGTKSDFDTFVNRIAERETTPIVIEKGL